MKLRNKKTGEIVIFGEGIVDLNQIGCKNVVEMIEAGWEDYEEPKGYWYIDCAAHYQVDFCEFNEDTESDKEIGNYFATKEEAEEAVEKLKAFKRLKDKGFRFTGWSSVYGISYKVSDEFYDSNDLIPRNTRDDLDLLFGGEG